MLGKQPHWGWSFSFRGLLWRQSSCMSIGGMYSQPLALGINQRENAILYTVRARKEESISLDVI